MQADREFVVLRHEHQGVHWDFMLQWGDVLRTWALERAPDEPGVIAARRLPDHRLVYLDYEGPVSGDRGSVAQWDRGTYELVEERADRVRVRLEGRRLQGQIELEIERPAEQWVFRRLGVE